MEGCQIHCSLVKLFVFGNVPFRQIEARSQPIPFHVTEPLMICPEFLGNPQKSIGLLAVDQSMERLVNPFPFVFVECHSQDFHQFIGLSIFKRNCITAPFFSRRF